MSLLTMTDCSVEDNLTQASHELARAELTGSADAFTAWAMKWGVSLIESARENVDKGEADEGSLAQAEQEASDAEDRVAALEGIIGDAINKLDKIEASEEIRDTIDAAIANLENAL